MEYKFTNENFESEVLQSDIPVLVDFYADWCGPCKMMAPIIAQLAEKYDGKVKVGKCNIDEEDGLARMYRVSWRKCCNFEIGRLKKSGRSA